MSQHQCVNTLRPRQNGAVLQTNQTPFFNENVWVLIKNSLKFVPKCLISNILALVQIMAWRRPGDKLLSELMVVNLLTHICVTRPQWVNRVRKWYIYRVDSRMSVLLGSLLLLASLFQCGSERITFTHRPLVGKVCHCVTSGKVHVREHYHCHWHCMMNPTCIGMNYSIKKKTCWFITSECVNIRDVPGMILTMYGTQEYLHKLLQNI